MSVSLSVTFLNCEQFLNYCPCPIVRDCGAVYPARLLTYVKPLTVFGQRLRRGRLPMILHRAIFFRSTSTPLPQASKSARVRPQIRPLKTSKQASQTSNKAYQTPKQASQTLIQAFKTPMQASQTPMQASQTPNWAYRTNSGLSNPKLASQTTSWPLKPQVRCLRP